MEAVRIEWSRPHICNRGCRFFVSRQNKWDPPNQKKEIRPIFMARDALKSQCRCDTYPPPLLFLAWSAKKYKEPPPTLRFPRTQCARAAHQLGFISEWSKNGNSYIGKCAPGPSNQQRKCSVCFFFLLLPPHPSPPVSCLVPRPV